MLLPGLATHQEPDPSQIVTATGPSAKLADLPITYEELKLAVFNCTQQIQLEQQQQALMAQMTQMVPPQNAPR